MKKFIILFICFSAPLLMGIGVVEFAVHAIPNSYSYKASIAETEASKAQVLVLGSSLAYCHINPDSLSLHAINMANSAQPLRYDLFLFEKYSPEMTKLQYVVMPISYFTFADNINDYIGVGRDVYYSQYYGFPYPPKPEYYLHSSNMIAALGKIKQHYINHAFDIEFDCRTNGFSALSIERRQAAGDDWDRGQEVATLYKEKNAQFLQERKSSCIKAFDNLAKQCAERGVQLILYTAPVTKQYRQTMDSDQWLQIQQAVQQIKQQNTNVHYYNFIDDKAFSDDDFKDADHLLESGANKLTKLIDKQLW